MSTPVRAERSDFPAIVRLCQRAIAAPPSAQELEDALFAPEQPATLFAIPERGVAAVVECDDGPHLRLLAVDPAARGEGLGQVLLQETEDWARQEGHKTLITGADPPYFLWPGVPSAETALHCLLERRHYARAETNFNMHVDLSQIPDDPGRYELATLRQRDEVDSFMRDHWSNWRLEVLRALDKGNLVIDRAGGDGGITAFCAFEVNRLGLLGPVAVRPDLMGQGMGKAVLLGALHELRRRGANEVSVVWVGPIAPYAAVGGSVTDVFFVYRKNLA